MPTISRAIATMNLDLNVEQEKTLLTALGDFYDIARREQGYTGGYSSPKDSPDVGSWMWKRIVAQSSYEEDYSWRTGLKDEMIWKKSNRSLKIFNSQVDEHYVQIKRSMLRNHRFFTNDTEGSEDKTTGKERQIRLVQRRLQWRSRKTDLRNRLDDAVLKAMVCGEALVKPSLRFTTKPVVKVARYLMEPDGGKPLRDTSGNLVPFDAEWVTLPDGTIQLRTDPSLTFPSSVVFPQSEKPKKFYRADKVNAGSNFDIIDHRDFVCDPRYQTISDAPYRGYEFSWTFDQLREYLSSWDIDKDAMAEYEAIVKQPGSDSTAAAQRAKPEHGENAAEQSSTQNTNNKGTQGLIRFVEEWVSIDVLGLDFCQKVLAIRDVERDILLAYTFAEDGLTWADPSLKLEHPFIVIRSAKVPHRWYGKGYFAAMEDDINIVDLIQNAIMLEIKDGGNVKFCWPKKIKNMRDNKPLRVRGPLANELEAGVMDAREAFDVIPIVPQIAEMKGQLEFEMGRVRTRYGQLQPGSSDAGLEGANTLGGMQIIQDKSNAYIDARINVISDGLDECVRAFARIELINNDYGDTLDQMGEENAKLVKSFIDQNKADFADSMDTLLANANNTTALNQNMQVTQVLQTWHTWPPERRKLDKDVFTRILLGLGEQNPDEMLSTQIYETTIGPDGLPTATTTAGPVGAPAGAPIPGEAPAPAPPVTPEPPASAGPFG